MAKSFDELANRTMTPERRAKARSLTKKYLVAMLREEIRRVARENPTIKTILEAFAGDLEIIACFPKADVGMRSCARWRN